MVARLFLTFLITAIPLVSGLQKIRPNLRQLQDVDADMIAAKHNMGVEAVMEKVGSDASVQEILDVLYEAMEGDEEIGDFDETSMSALASAVYPSDENGAVNVTESLMAQSAFLSDTNPVMEAVYEVLTHLEDVDNVDECTDKVDAAAEKSGEDSQMKLASISDAVAAGSGEYWNEASEGRRKLQLTALITIIIADVIGALIGFALGGIIGAIVLGVLASVLAAFQLGFPSPFLLC